MAKKTSTRTLQRMRDEGTPISMITAYDATFAALFERAGVDAILVGDSLGNVVQGRGTTLPVTVDEIIYHTAAVVRGTERVHVVADLPFGSYGVSTAESVANACRVMKESGAHAVKLEGGRRMAELVDQIVGIGVPVMGHLGFTPQSVHAFGGHYVQGRGTAADDLVADALALEAAGAYAIVLELVPAPVAARVTEALRIPTIGIGAGNATSGQVLVCYDMLGMNDAFSPKFLKKYADLSGVIRGATEAYVREVRDRTYPDAEHAFED
ncbi:MAG: 3-methyl-2-oxobutanoate hydroxymethyltransferase [Myxococcales bacterium]|nr:3-methyl-2-oxobutanoate hydroxymethyltransferase [Myxococcales bacterium]MCB9531279.1 3-methyl-2-oxobutanoate hydroxymethyltransferase [Myxococcales bacterium]